MNTRRVESSLLFIIAFFASHAVTILIFMFAFDARENSSRIADFILFGVMLGAFLTAGSAVGYVAVTMFFPAVKKLSDIILVRSGFVAGFGGYLLLCAAVETNYKSGFQLFNFLDGKDWLWVVAWLSPGAIAGFSVLLLSTGLSQTIRHSREREGRSRPT